MLNWPEILFATCTVCARCGPVSAPRAGCSAWTWDRRRGTDHASDPRGQAQWRGYWPPCCPRHQREHQSSLTSSHSSGYSATWCWRMRYKSTRRCTQFNEERLHQRKRIRGQRINWGLTCRGCPCSWSDSRSQTPRSRCWGRGSWLARARCTCPRRPCQARSPCPRCEPWAPPRQTCSVASSRHSLICWTESSWDSPLCSLSFSLSAPVSQTPGQLNHIISSALVTFLSTSVSGISRPSRRAFLSRISPLVSPTSLLLLFMSRIRFGSGVEDLDTGKY